MRIHRRRLRAACVGVLLVGALASAYDPLLGAVLLIGGAFGFIASLTIRNGRL